jgi:hypothetical protein
MPALWGAIPGDEWKNHEPYNPPNGRGNRPIILLFDQLNHFPF